MLIARNIQVKNYIDRVNVRWEVVDDQVDGEPSRESHDFSLNVTTDEVDEVLKTSILSYTVKATLLTAYDGKVLSIGLDGKIAYNDKPIPKIEPPILVADPVQEVPQVL